MRFSGSAERDGVDVGSLPWLKSYPTAVDWQIEIPERPLASLIEDALSQAPDNACMTFLGKKYRYRDIADLIDRAAAGLQKLGVSEGTRVGLLLPNSPYFLVCFYAILKAGGVVTTFNVLLAEKEIREQIADSGTEIVVTIDLAALYDKLTPALGPTALRSIVVCRLDRALPLWKGLMFRLFKRKARARIPRDTNHVPFDRLIEINGPVRPVARDLDRDPAVILYTAGTTGRPKGVVLSQRSLLANAIQSRVWFTKVELGRERVLAVLPFFHAFGLTAVMNFALSIGATLVVLPRFEVSEVLATIRRARPTFFSVVPTILRAILDSRLATQADFSSFKVCVSGGDGLPIDLRTRFQEATGVPVTEGYGLSEAGPVVSCGNPLEGADKPGSVGLPLPGTTVEIVSIEDGRTRMPGGELGEICVAGPQVMLGYWALPELTEAAMAGGILHSGDIGYLDEDGFLFVVDRLKDVVKTGGYTVYPSAVEAAILLHGAVAEVAVVGVPDDYWGQAITAFIVREPCTTVTQDDLVAFLEDKVSAIECPKRFVFRDSLPKSPIGKVLKRVLAQETRESAAGTGAVERIRQRSE